MIALPGSVASQQRVEPPTLRTLPTAVTDNVRIARAHTTAQVMAVVKADGYGHGATEVARAALAGGATWLGTTDMHEAQQLRSGGVAVPILTWLHPSGLDAAAALEHRIDVAVGSVDELAGILAQRPAAPVRVHLHVDTGMARGGCPPGQWRRLVEHAQQGTCAGLIRVVGLMGHLADADLARPERNAGAAERMRAADFDLGSVGLRPAVKHLAATAATLTDPNTHFDMVRFGAGLVGIDPSNTTRLHGASTLTAPVVHSVTVADGTRVGYGGTWAAPHATNLSVLPVGYADGIPRELSTNAWVLVGDTRHRIVGRVSMDQIVIDTGSRRVPPGTMGTLFGPAGTDAPSVQDWAHWAGTIPHSIVTSIGSRVNRTSA